MDENRLSNSWASVAVRLNMSPVQTSMSGDSWVSLATILLRYLLRGERLPRWKSVMWAMRMPSNSSGRLWEWMVTSRTWMRWRVAMPVMMPIAVMMDSATPMWCNTRRLRWAMRLIALLRT